MEKVTNIRQKVTKYKVKSNKSTIPFQFKEDSRTFVTGATKCGALSGVLK